MFSTPPTAILLGDFNAHSKTWGCRDNNSHGKLIDDFYIETEPFNSEYRYSDLFPSGIRKLVCH